MITAERPNIEGAYQPVTATIKLRKSWLKVPFVDAGTLPPRLDVVPPSVGLTVENAEPAKSREEFIREFLMVPPG